MSTKSPSLTALRIVVFACGAVVMILELVASRIIAPYLGTSIIIWTSLIGIILGSLSLGYWWGGKLADDKPSFRKLSVVIFIAAVLVGAITYFKPVLGIIAAIDSLQASALLATLVLFAPATVVLGIVTPYAARLCLNTIENSGKTIGNLYALSTLGSIVGTFLGGFFLISFFGSTKILAVLSLALALCSLAIFIASKITKSERFWLFLYLIFLIPFIMPAPGVLLARGSTLLADIDTNYNRMWVYDRPEPITGRPTRNLTNTVEVTQSSIYLDNPTELLGQYPKVFDLARYLYPSFTKTAMIGAGSFSYPEHFTAAYPAAKMTVVEIDPKLTGIAKQYFFFKDSPNITIRNEDGRTFLNTNTDTYQVMYIDAFLSYWAIPFQLTTREAVSRIKDSLASDGMAFVNIISGITGRGGEFFRAEYATYASVFPYLYVFQISTSTSPNRIQNIVLLASKSDLSKKILAGEKQNPLFSRLWKQPIENGLPILADDFAPVELYTSRAFFVP